MSIYYFSLNITSSNPNKNFFSGSFGVDETSKKVIKFFNSVNGNENILNTDVTNSNNADWIFGIDKKFSENGTIINNIPLLNIAGSKKFKLYTRNNINYIDFYNGSDWINIKGYVFDFNIQYIYTFTPAYNQYGKNRNMTIEKFCSLQQRRGLTRFGGGCNIALPPSKDYLFTNSGKTPCNPEFKNKMKYAEYIRIYGGTTKSSSGFKKYCNIAGPTFSY